MAFSEERMRLHTFSREQHQIGDGNRSGQVDWWKWTIQMKRFRGRCITVHYPVQSTHESWTRHARIWLWRGVHPKAVIISPWGNIFVRKRLVHGGFLIASVIRKKPPRWKSVLTDCRLLTQNGLWQTLCWASRKGQLFLGPSTRLILWSS